MQQEKRPVFVYLCVMGILMSFVGWVAENFARAVTQGILDARFHILPFISAYSLIVFAFYYLCGDPNDFKPFGRRIFRERTKKTVLLSNLLALLFAFLFVFVARDTVRGADPDAWLRRRRFSAFEVCVFTPASPFAGEDVL